MFDITIGAITDKGKTRNVNQDFYGYYTPRIPAKRKKGVLLVLADGMGGYSGGEVASRVAVEILMANYYSDGINNTFQSIKNLFYMANESIIKKAQQDSSLKDMGTTLTAVIVKRNKLFCAHVGDSRAYLISKDEMIQLTSDHSYVANLVREGRITEKEAETHPERNIITRAVGAAKDLTIDTFKRKFNSKKTPYLLICSDGLYKDVSNDVIIKTVFTNKTPQIICDKLVGVANENGGSDNITVIVVRFDDKSWYNRFF